MERRQVRGSALLLSGRGLDLALSAATQVIIVRVLSKADYGAFAYALALAAIGQTLLSLGQGQLLSRFMAMYEEQRDYARMLGAMFIAVATIAVTSAVAIGALYLWSHQLVGSSVHSHVGVKLVLILAFLAPVAALDQVCVALFAVFSRPGAIFVRKYVLAPGLRLAVVLILAVTGAGVTFVAVGYLVTSAGGLLLYVGVLVVVLRTRGLFGQMSPRRVILPFRAVFSFSFPLITGQLAVLSLTVGGVFVLARVHSTTAVADYRSVFTAAQLNTAVQQAFAILFLPLAARLFTRGDIDGLRDSYWHTAAVVAVLTFPIFALTGPLAPDTTVSLFGSRYAASATVLAVLAVGYYVNVSLGFNAYALQVCGRIRFLVVVNVAVIAVNLALCWALAPRLSAVGVAAANAVALIGQNLANQWALRRSLRCGFLPRAYLRCYASIAVAAAALWGLQFLVHPRVVVAVAAAMAASVVVLAVSRAPLRLGATFPELRRIPLVAPARRCIATARRRIGTAPTHRRPGRGLAEPGNRHFAYGRVMTGVSLERKTRPGAVCREEQARYDHAPPDSDHALPSRSLSAQVGRRAHQGKRDVSIGGDPSRPWPPPDNNDTEPILSAPLRPVPGPAAMAGRRQRRRRPRPGDELAGSGLGENRGPGSVFADRGGIAIGQVVQQRPGITGKPVRLAEPPPLLAGREDLLAELDARLSGHDSSRPQTVALTGFGGTGKTSVVLAYAHRHLAEVGAAWQFAAEDPVVLATGFGELAAQLGARDVVDTRDPVASVHRVLAAFPAGWLLLFDNAPDRASVEAFLPPEGPGRVLITSQNQQWPSAQALQVPVLDIEVAADFLAHRTGDHDRQAAEGLAGELDGLPLALEQAAAYIQATGTTLAGYLSVFQSRRADLLARGEATGHRSDVVATLGLTLARLEAKAPAAAGLMRLLACLAPEPVPLALLLSDAQIADKLAPDAADTVGPLLGDPLAAGDAVAALRRYSLLTPAGNGLVLMHRLVQDITLNQVPEDETGHWRQGAAMLLEATIPRDPELPATWPVCAVLLPHARAVLEPTSDGMRRIVDYLGYSGSYPAARDLSQLIADAYDEDDIYGPEHPDVLTARANLAYWSGRAGDAAGARDQYAALLPVVERVSGPEHPHTLAARHNLARWSGLAGDAAGARDQYATLLPTRERVSGPEHPDTLTARGVLAYWTGETGDAAGARDQFAALLPVLEQVLGREHPHTLAVQNYLAYWTKKAKRWRRVRY